MIYPNNGKIFTWSFLFIVKSLDSSNHILTYLGIHAIILVLDGLGRGSMIFPYLETILLPSLKSYHILSCAMSY